MNDKQLDKLFQQLSIGRRCKECGKPAECIHHYIPRANLSLRWEVFNAIPLCFNCHRDYHDGKFKITSKHIGENQKFWCDSRKNSVLKDELIFRGITKQEFMQEKERQIKRDIYAGN